jgi:hypothetical protein
MRQLPEEVQSVRRRYVRQANKMLLNGDHKFVLANGGANTTPPDFEVAAFITTPTKLLALTS